MRLRQEAAERPGEPVFGPFDPQQARSAHGLGGRLDRVDLLAGKYAPPGHRQGP